MERRNSEVEANSFRGDITVRDLRRTRKAWSPQLSNWWAKRWRNGAPLDRGVTAVPSQRRALSAKDQALTRLGTCRALFARTHVPSADWRTFMDSVPPISGSDAATSRNRGLAPTSSRTGGVPWGPAPPRVALLKEREGVPTRRERRAANSFRGAIPLISVDPVLRDRGLERRRAARPGRVSYALLAWRAGWLRRGLQCGASVLLHLRDQGKPLNTRSESGEFAISLSRRIILGTSFSAGAPLGA